MVMGRGYGLPPKIFSLMAMPASSASMTPGVIMRTAVCMAVRRTSRMQSTRERRSRMSRAASSPSRPTSASARFAPCSAARVSIALSSAFDRSELCGVIGASPILGLSRLNQHLEIGAILAGPRIFLEIEDHRVDEGPPFRGDGAGLGAGTDRQDGRCFRDQPCLHDGLGAAQIMNMAPEGEAILPPLDQHPVRIADDHSLLEGDPAPQASGNHSHSRILR